MAILIIAVFCLLCVGSYLIFEPDQVSEYTDNLDIHYYSDYDYGLNITSFNNASPVTGSQGLLRFNNIKNEVLGTEKAKNGNFTYYKNNKLGTYTVFVEDKMSSNFILMSSKDLTILNTVYDSLEARIIVDDYELQQMYSNNTSNNSSRYY